MEKRKVSELKYYPGNPRKIDDKTLKQLKKSITEFGIVENLVINSKNQIIGGNQRLKALKDLGIEEVDCYVVDLSDGQEKALNLALNKIQGEWDEELLKEFLSDLNQYEIDLSGFDELDIKELNAEFVPVDIDTQPRLDEKKKHKCPKCGYEF